MILLEDAPVMIFARYTISCNRPKIVRICNLLEADIGVYKADSRFFNESRYTAERNLGAVEPIQESAEKTIFSPLFIFYFNLWL
jgi:hypothetical protein